MSVVARNLAAVEARIAEACRKSGREPGAVRLLPVSKTKPPELIVEALAAGYRRFGENRVQEAQDKWELTRDEHPELEWAIIGALQANKAKYVARFATELQALDDLHVARELDKRLCAEGRQLDVLVQVNSSAEPQKAGIDPDAAEAFTRELAGFDALRPRGLMTLAVHSDDPASVRACFARTRAVQERLRDRDGGGWDELSMGMSGDFELAVAEGSTCVRVGTAIFGGRGDQAAWRRA